ncbi:MAG: YeeE/YedE thiosulfate transporter family protein [Gammaproteobacteria bacterium]|nr:YeeE/YedE thiosulfate transporter family protein [Gammaproteobacteria bacterium]
MNNTVVIWPFAIFLVFLMGFVADRTNLCSVNAVKEVLFKRRASLLLSFARIVLWVLGVSMLLEWLFGVSSPTRTNFQFGIPGLVGGILFGVGAVLNNGCSLHTLTCLGRGNMDMAVSISGLIIGAMAAKALFGQVPGLAPVAVEPALAVDLFYRDMLLLTLTIGMLVELFRLLRGFRFSECKSRLLASEYLLPSAAALLGIANGILLALVGTWMYTYTLIQGASNLLFPDSGFYQPLPGLLWLLLLAYLGGIVASSYSRHELAVAIHPGLQWFRYLAGGILMGVGASMIPGGNDVLLLNAIPGLSWHALPAYLSMLGGVAIALLVLKHYFATDL